MAKDQSPQKMLLTEDYQNIVQESFQLLERDHYKHYVNFINENIENNSDIFDELLTALTGWIEWFDNSPDYFYFVPDNIVIEGPHLQTRTKYINILSFCNINRSINRTFFTDQIDTIGEIRDNFQLGTNDDIPEEPKGTIRPPKQRPKSLLDLWLPGSNGSKDEYYRQIDKLKEEYPPIGAPFIYKENNALLWNNYLRGKYKYLSGWLYKCRKKGWINKDSSCKDFQIAVNITFNAQANSDTSLKSVKSGDLSEKYLSPFSDIPVND